VPGDRLGLAGRRALVSGGQARNSFTGIAVFCACDTVGTTRKAELAAARITITNFTVSLLFRRDAAA